MKLENEQKFYDFLDHWITYTHNLSVVTHAPLPDFAGEITNEEYQAIWNQGRKDILRVVMTEFKPLTEKGF